MLAGAVIVCVLVHENPLKAVSALIIAITTNKQINEQGNTSTARRVNQEMMTWLYKDP